jgi:hypothetical protein
MRPRQLLDATCARSENQRQRQCDGPTRRPRTFISRDRPAQDSSNAIDQGSTGCCHRQRHTVGPRLLQHSESLRVVERIAANGDRDVVAAMLALNSDPFRYPPDRGVIKQHRFGERLEHVDEIVVAPDVGELVRENRLHLRWC